MWFENVPRDQHIIDVIVTTDMTRANITVISTIHGSPFTIHIKDGGRVTRTLTGVTGMNFCTITY